jgi:hypothetical protein
VHVQVDVGAREVRALAQSGEGGPEYLVAGALQNGRDEAPFPAARPGAVDEDEGGHDPF